ncbi:nitroreductase family protein [Clostridium merdae]|uniref:nitroreductase family protein n=1 Tax=Clostridium merdae TaxID=1958780 RepID=UPI001FA93C2B|nr:nitroreductase family protein [Clostridium merdae]
MMKMNFPVEKTVRARQSIRSYQETPIPAEVISKIRSYMEELTNPFSVEVSLHLLEKNVTSNGEKLGTYGVIKGASHFIGASVAPCELGLEALGYSFEKLILYITSLGLGTCWLGGTFDRSAFSSAMKRNPDEFFPVISPFGYAQEKKRMLESMMRFVAKSDQRQEWSALFFEEDFAHPLTQAAAGDYAFPLEMLRLAPSAVNKQPWRVVKSNGHFHFYKIHSEKESKLGIDIQRTDVGIAACHFHLSAQERDLIGHFTRLKNPILQAPGLDYLFSWVKE